MYVKLHEHGRDRLLAACDDDLLGKDLGNGFVVSKQFYGGELVGAGAFEEHLGECTVANLVGEKVIRIAKRKGLVRDKAVIRVSGVPHAQFVRML